MDRDGEDSKNVEISPVRSLDRILKLVKNGNLEIPNLEIYVEFDSFDRSVKSILRIAIHHFENR